MLESLYNILDKTEDENDRATIREAIARIEQTTEPPQIPRDTIRARLYEIRHTLREHDRDNLLIKYKRMHGNEFTYGTTEELKIYIAGDMIQDILWDIATGDIY